MKLSIIIPVFNEEKTITIVLERLQKVKLPCQKEIIIIDDASTDGTSKRITEYIKIHNSKQEIQYIRHNQNQGKGSAIRTGTKKSSGGYVLIQDADLEYNPNEISKLLSPLLGQGKNSQNVAIYGSRFSSRFVANSSISPLYLFGNKFLTLLTNILYGVKLTDMETGYKLIPGSFFRKNILKSNRFDIEPEITIKLIKMNMPIIEVPISYKGRTHIAGKKLTLLDAYEAVRVLIYYKFFSS